MRREIKKTYLWGLWSKTTVLEYRHPDLELDKMTIEIDVDSAAAMRKLKDLTIKANGLGDAVRKLDDAVSGREGESNGQ